MPIAATVTLGNRLALFAGCSTVGSLPVTALGDEGVTTTLASDGPISVPCFRSDHRSLRVESCVMPP